MTHAVRFSLEKNPIHNTQLVGQKKRLALVYIMLDDRPFIVLDEWAAEQDSQFRIIFYHDLLPPHLKNLGKAMMVMSMTTIS